MEVHANAVMSTGLLPLARHYSSRLIKVNHRRRCLLSNTGPCWK